MSDALWLESWDDRLGPSVWLLLNVVTLVRMSPPVTEFEAPILAEPATQSAPPDTTMDIAKTGQGKISTCTWLSNANRRDQKSWEMWT